MVDAWIDSCNRLLDLVGRPLLVPFVSTFATEDAKPPEVLSFTPDEGSINVDVTLSLAAAEGDGSAPGIAFWASRRSRST